MRCKEISSDLLFDAMPWGEDAVLVRQASPDPVDLFVISLVEFVENFSPIGD